MVGGAAGVTVGHPEWLPTAPILLGGLGLIALAGIILVHAELVHQSAAVVHGRSVDGDEQQMGRSAPAYSAEEPPASRHPAAEHPAASPLDAEPRAPNGEQAQLALPVPSGQWWGRGNPSAHAPGAAPASGHAPPPDLETYLQSSIIAQCPRCGSFQLDAEAVPPGYGFECRTCGLGWHWHPDQPWPAVRVNPRLSPTGARTEAPGVAGR
ncbi:hypothetical protein [Geodermatophilus africanus]|uniref:hypothetical protein n=1 Tax=Geodermatophilus africanus TaxID=1137993 RepID=UPI001114787A|nr:hypothetical protein [Geodermatophilus africanus]